VVHYYVKTLEYTPDEYDSCLKCGEKNLVRNKVIANIGTTKQNLSPKESILCPNCETLMIITDEEKAMIELRLRDSKDTITIRHSDSKKN